ncbi:MAG: hypothetical protein IJV35_09815 [Neisseriaceae bacterium]|nr:hypothetical protein [Neisseriaceae bacterium]
MAYYKGRTGFYLLFAPLLIVWLLLYLVIMHTDLFSWVNIEQLKSFTPDVFMPINRDGLYNEAVLAGTISYISLFFLPLYCFLILILPPFLHNDIDDLKKRIFDTYERMENFGRIRINGKIKVFFMFLFLLFCIFGFITSSIHNNTSSSYVIQSLSFIKAYPKRYLLMDFISLNFLYFMVSMLFFVTILPLFFYAKKEK